MTKRRAGAMTRAEAAAIARQRRMEKMPPLEERFWSKVDRRGPDECWPWTASVICKGKAWRHITPEMERQFLEEMRARSARFRRDAR